MRYDELIEVEFWWHNDKGVENSVRRFVTGIVRTELRKIVKNYRISSHIESIVLTDCIKEYVTALSVYSYTDANLRRKRITYLLMKARGRDPNPEGSFNKADAMTWAESSTDFTDKEGVGKGIGVEYSAKGGEKGRKNQQFVSGIKFNIGLTAKNKVLANLEYGKTSWWGETENIKRLLFHEANEGYMLNRINLKERDEIITFADEMTDADKKGTNRPYLKTALNTAMKKYEMKWTKLIKEEMKRYIYSKYGREKAVIRIPEDMTSIKFKNVPKGGVK